MDENLLDRAYRVLMTPLPAPTLDVEGLLSALGEHGRRISAALGQATDLPERLPQMPEAWRAYAQRRGLFPPAGGP